MTTEVTTGQHRPTAVDFRQRLLNALADSIAEVGYGPTTVADIVKRARTSRRTFYEHFTSREDCFIALLKLSNSDMVQQIAGAVDRQATWEQQVRQAIEAWIGHAEAVPHLTLSWIRETRSLASKDARDLERGATEAFVMMVQYLCDTEEWQGIRPVPRKLVLMLIGGLRELVASTVEDGGKVSDVTETAVNGSIALLGSLRQ